MAINAAKLGLKEGSVWSRAYKQFRTYRRYYLIPTILWSLIFLDYSHTQKWKKQQQAIQDNKLKLS